MSLKVESARLLQPSEYTLNSTLGYLSLNVALNADEVLGVAYEYTYNGQVFQVGEFSSDITVSDQSLYVKMLKSTTLDPHQPMWHLMMKNVYSLGAYQVEPSNFKLNIKYLSDTTGTPINYLPIARLSHKPLLQVMNLDRLDANEVSNPDGLFDFIDGYTIPPSTGKVIFPVVEPFGKHLARRLTILSLPSVTCIRSCMTRHLSSHASLPIRTNSSLPVNIRPPTAHR